MTFPGMMRDSDDSFNKMIFISLFLHIVALAVIFSLPSLPSPRWTFGPVYSVQLVSLSEEFQGKKSTSLIAQDIRETMPVKRHPDTAITVPIKRIDTQKKQVSGVERAIEDIRKKVASSAGQPGSSGPVDEAEFSSKINAYYALIWSRIKGQWALPQGILPRENIEAIIQARILKNGAVTDLGFEKRSGNRYFDESAMRAVKKASPFPPLPAWIKDGSIEIGIRFHSSEFR